MNIIHESFKHGDNFRIGHFCIIEEDVVVGDNVNIQNYVLLKKGTKIGNDVYVDSYVRSSGDNKIGNNVTLRFGATIAREVTIGDGVFISPNVMTIYSDHAGKAMPGTEIGDGVHIGTAAVIGPAVYIRDRAVVGAMAFVKANADLDADGIYIGIPAKKLER